MTEGGLQRNGMSFKSRKKIRESWRSLLYKVNTSRPIA
jgi:hypothetical protein